VYARHQHAAILEQRRRVAVLSFDSFSLPLPNDVSPGKNFVLKFKRDVVISLRIALRLRIHGESPKSLNEVQENVMVHLFGVHGF
jgi:hypothetical protein